ncbi:MAG: YraN family protein [Methylacidiphilales bacterium]|nr:YraN family protein [Candidatus Methylacidiphilales bacterium]
MPGDRKGRGDFGEEAACAFLKRQHYKPLVRNYRSRWGEIDLVCRHKGVLVFVEVKARSPESWGSPAEAVTPSKQRRILRTAMAYLEEIKLQDMPVRFDVVEVFLKSSGPPECHLIPAAFELTRRNS